MKDAFSLFYRMHGQGADSRGELDMYQSICAL